MSIKYLHTTMPICFAVSMSYVCREIYHRPPRLFTLYPEFFAGPSEIRYDNVNFGVPCQISVDAMHLRPVECN